MENKKDFERFAAQYWGQELLYINGSERLIFPLDVYYIARFCQQGRSYLQLRSIESLTDEELMSLFHFINPGRERYKFDPIVREDQLFLYKYEWLDVDNQDMHSSIALYKAMLMNTRKSADYLRSIGILVPFDKYSVEQILSLGWAMVK